MKILVTGGAGFIGSNFIHYILHDYPDWQLTNLDKLTYAGNLENLKDIEGNPRYQFVKGDITDARLVDNLLRQKFDAIVNFAAESHVDRSILDASPFIQTNVQGTQVLLEGARKHEVKLFLQISTDEVYGSAEGSDRFTEQNTIAPNSPYAACKAAADCLCRAYSHTYGLPVVITRCSNNYGPFQFPEKFLPLVITNALEGKPIPVYGDGLNVRDWTHVLDHCRGIATVVQKGKPGEVYNIGGGNEKTNLEMVKRILKIMGKPESLITFVPDRLGHDRRYALDATKIQRQLGFVPGVPFEEGIKKTVEWYVTNESWWRRVKTAEYSKYYDSVYSHREDKGGRGDSGGKA